MSNNSAKTPSRKTYTNKNAESNVINRVLTFVSSFRKSSEVLRRLVRKLGFSAETVILYYAYVGVLKAKFKGKYRSKLFLSNICANPDCEDLRPIISSGTYREKLPLENFCRLLRTLVLHFLEELCPRVLIVSRKIRKTAIIEHLQRRTKLIRYLRGRTSD